MDTYAAVEIAADNAGLSLNRVSRLMGKADAYISSSRSRGSVPSTENAATMLDLCGYALCAVPRGEVPKSALTIDPPKRKGQ